MAAIVFLHLVAFDARLGADDRPMVPNAAMSLADLDNHSFQRLPESTTDGVVCARCSADARRWGKVSQVRHASVGHVRRCCDVFAEWEADAREELAAEAAVERFFEDRGYEEARAQERYEASLGIY